MELRCRREGGGVSYRTVVGAELVDLVAELEFKYFGLPVLPHYRLLSCPFGPGPNSISLFQDFVQEI